MLLWVVTILSVISAAAVSFFTGSFAGLAWLWVLPLTFLGTFLGIVLLGFLFVLFLCSLVDQSVQQEDDNKFYRFVAETIVESALPFLRIHVKKSGLEKMPEGRFLLVCNHASESDPIILLSCLMKRQLTFISKREASNTFVVGPMMYRCMAQLLNRENDREALKTILRCIQIIKEDKVSVGVFPEGGILEEYGKLHRFKPGVFKIAQKAEVPVVVCCLKNTLPVVPNILHLRPSYVERKVVDVIPVEDVRNHTTVELAHRCHDLIAEELGPDLVAED